MLELATLKATRKVRMGKVLDTILNVFKDEFNDIITVTDINNTEKRTIGVNYTTFEYIGGVLNETLNPVEAVDILHEYVEAALGNEGYLIEAKKAILFDFTLNHVLNLFHIMTKKDLEKINNLTTNIRLLNMVLGLDEDIEDSVYRMNDVTKKVVEATLKDLEWDLEIVETDEEETINVSDCIVDLLSSKGSSKTMPSNKKPGKLYKFVKKG